MSEYQERDSDKITRIVIAVHGIGDQVRNATAQQVAKMFGAGVIPLGAFPEKIEVKADGADPKIEPACVTDPARWEIGDEEWRRAWMEAGTAFAEVYWADIPRAMAKSGYTVQETKSWGLTVVDRLRARDTRPSSRLERKGQRAATTANTMTAGGAAGHATARSGPPKSYRLLAKENKLRVDYDKAASVLEEFVDGINLVETIGKVGGKVGLPEFDAGKVLNDYVNDVQVVAEFREQRQRIVSRFIRTLRKVHEAHRGAEIHIVAHSEGTVVALLGLLHAYCDTPLYRASLVHLDKKTQTIVPDPKPETGRDWLGKVRGLMTIGSPIDKHIVMWPDLWEGEDWREPADKQGRFFVEKPVPWFNYYDSSDPVGYELDTAREFFGDSERGLVSGNPDVVAQKPLLAFPDDHDNGFTRYPLPGKAHNDYFTDPDVFSHYSRQVAGDRAACAPKTRHWAWAISRICPYLLVTAVLALGVWLLHKAVLGYVIREDGPEQHTRDVGTTLLAPNADFPALPRASPPNPGNSLRNVIGITLLVAGLTVVTRLARMTRGRSTLLGGWHALGFLIYLGGVVGFTVLVSDGLKETMGRGIVGWQSASSSGWHWAVVGLAAIGAAMLPFLPELKRRRLVVPCAVAAWSFVAWLIWLGSRGEWQSWGVVLGSVGVSVVGWVLAFSLPRWGMLPLIISGGLLAALSILGCLFGRGAEGDQTLWPVALAAVAFVYLWWLAAVLFDLSFAWHRYICGGEAMSQLRAVFEQCDPRCKHVVPAAAPTK